MKRPLMVLLRVTCKGRSTYQEVSDSRQFVADNIAVEAVSRSPKKIIAAAVAARGAVILR